MSEKNIIRPIQVVTNGDMSTASVTSAITNIQYQDNMSYFAVFTGSPVGSFDVQVSLDYNPVNGTNLQNPAIPRNDTGSWAPLGLNVASAGGSPQEIDLNQLSAPWIRLVYTRVSGSGTLQAYFCSKTI